MTDMLPHRKGWIVVGILALAALVTLFAMDRPPICECGTIKFWHGDINSSGNSQHISDWYTPSHVIHGMLFYFLAWSLFVKFDLGGPAATKWSFPLAVAIEASWEVIENTPLIIERYRSVTVNWGYSGDSIINSIADLGWMSLGFYMAWKLPVRATVALAIAAELITGWVVHDNLTLNVLMLVWPLEAVRQWQGMG